MKFEGERIELLAVEASGTETQNPRQNMQDLNTDAPLSMTARDRALIYLSAQLARALVIVPQDVTAVQHSRLWFKDIY